MSGNANGAIAPSSSKSIPPEARQCEMRSLISCKLEDDAAASDRTILLKVHSPKVEAEREVIALCLKPVQLLTIGVAMAIN